MAQLSNEELEEAAAEAGISPQELRHALAERQGSALARPDQAHSLMGAPTRGASVTFVEGRIAQPPPRAITTVRSSIERQTGRSGHRQGELEADVVDDAQGLTYRLRTQDDGGGGALVRVDIDPTAGRSFRNILATAVIGVTLAVVGLAILLGSTMMVGLGIGLGVLGGLGLARRSGRLQGAIAAARAIAAHALAEAENEAPEALPPGR